MTEKFSRWDSSDELKTDEDMARLDAKVERIGAKVDRMAAEIKQQIAEMKSEMIRWVVAVGGVQMGLIAVLLLEPIR